jgi:hypothetical protein
MQGHELLSMHYELASCFPYVRTCCTCCTHSPLDLHPHPRPTPHTARLYTRQMEVADLRKQIEILTDRSKLEQTRIETRLQVSLSTSATPPPLPPLLCLYLTHEVHRHRNRSTT